MKKIIILIITAVLFLPSNANAGFMAGYVIGSMNSSSLNNIASPEGIPPICMVEKTFEEFAKCRLPSARLIDWVTTNTDNNSGEWMNVDDLINKEWVLIQDLNQVKK